MKAEEVTLGEAQKMFLADHNRELEDQVKLITREIGQLISKGVLAKEERIPLLFTGETLGQVYNDGTVKVFQNFTATFYKSVAEQMMRDFPKDFIRVKDNETAAEAVSRLKRGKSA